MLNALRFKSGGLLKKAKLGGAMSRSRIIRNKVNTSNGLLNSLAAYWKMDEASGTRVDATGKGNNLTSVNGTSVTDGVINNAALFDGTDWLGISSISFIPSGTSDVTFSFWFRLDDVIGGGTPTLLEATDYLTGFLIRCYFGFTIQVFLAGNVYEFPQLFDLGTVHHLVVRRKSGALEVFFDSVSLGSVAANDSVTSTGTGTIGQDNRTHGDPWVGFIDETGIWSVALTDSQIAALYNSGAGLPYENFVT